MLPAQAVAPPGRLLERGLRMFTDVRDGEAPQLLALVILLLNCINSAGEYILSSIVKQAADAQVAAGAMTHADAHRFIGAFLSDYFGIVWLGTATLSLSVAQFAWISVALAVDWIGVCAATGVEFRRRSTAADAALDA